MVRYTTGFDLSTATNIRSILEVPKTLHNAPDNLDIWISRNTALLDKSRGDFLTCWELKILKTNSREG